MRTGCRSRPAFRHTFRAGPAVDEAIDIADWTLEVPEAGTREPLTVRFPRPLDHGIIVRALGVETGTGRSIDGKMALARMTPPGCSRRSRRGRAASTIWSRSRFSRILKGTRSAVRSKRPPANRTTGGAPETTSHGVDVVADAPSRLAFTIGTAP